LRMVAQVGFSRLRRGAAFKTVVPSFTSIVFPSIVKLTHVLSLRIIQKI
jgi:hypothetical protein